MVSTPQNHTKSIKQRVVALTARPFWLRYATLVPYRILCAASSAISGRTFSGAAHAERNTDAAVEYILDVFNKYKSASGTQRFYGRVAELGPGDSCGIGLMFLADGCEQVDLVDRFFSFRDEEQQEAINQAIVQRFPQLTMLRKNGNFSEESFTGLRRYYGKAAAAEKFFSTQGGYDFIVSCAVLEHVYDPVRAISAAASALNPGGMMLHQVDCRDHGQFSQHFHELKFLEVPGLMYLPLSWGGGPNRVLVSSYRNALQKAKMQFQIYVTSLAGVPELPRPMLMEQIPEDLIESSKLYISQVRSRLIRRFRDMRDEDLMVTGFLLSCAKGKN